MMFQEMVLSHNPLIVQFFLVILILSHNCPSLYQFLQLVGEAEYLHLIGKYDHMSRMGVADY